MSWQRPVSLLCCVPLVFDDARFKLNAPNANILINAHSRASAYLQRVWRRDRIVDHVLHVPWAVAWH